MAGSTLLLVEDDAPLRRSMRLALLDEDYQVLEAATGQEGLHHLKTNPDAVLLDVLLPDTDGIDLCRRIRPITPAPIVIISALAGNQDIARGLAAGADDYVTKPFRVADLAHRLRRLLQPLPGPDSTGHLQLGDLQLHHGQGVTDQRGNSVPLTRTELRLLFELAAEPGRVMARVELLDRVWGHRSNVTGQALESRLFSLRSKLVNSGHVALPVPTSHGYRLDA